MSDKRCDKRKRLLALGLIGASTIPLTTHIEQFDQPKSSKGDRIRKRQQWRRK